VPLHADGSLRVVRESDSLFGWLEDWLAGEELFDRPYRETGDGHGHHDCE
jgi:hypothetical protein